RHVHNIAAQNEFFEAVEHGSLLTGIGGKGMTAAREGQGPSLSELLSAQLQPDSLRRPPLDHHAYFAMRSFYRQRKIHLQPRHRTPPFRSARNEWLGFGTSIRYRYAKLAVG
ncbi:MAG TPA: hypothetical protein VND65_09290, partial [Candidatus Binatia bacterium]|nr:hypothetical protein [Candidatus Binatia bacterium]